MIKIDKEFILENVVGEFSHEWQLPDCVTLISSIIEDNKIKASFDFCDSNCLVDSNKINLLVESSDGCITEFNSIFENVCESFTFTQGGIVPLEDCDECTLGYKAPVNELNVNYEWEFNESIYTATYVGSRIYLNYIDNIDLHINSTPLSVKASNKYGCLLEDTIALDICEYEPLKFNFDILCSIGKNGTIGCSTASLTPLNPPCGLDLDYRTTQIVSVLNIDAESLYTQKTKQAISISTNEELTSTIVIELSTKDCTGFPYLYTLCLSPVEGSANPNIFDFDYTFGCLECEDSTAFRSVSSSRDESCTSNLSINIEELIEGDVNWSTFIFIPRAGQTLVDSTTLVTPFGEANLDINRNVLFSYEGGLASNEIIEYRIEVENIPTFGVLNFKGTRCGDTPVAVDTEVCVLSNSQTDYLDITANDSGDIDSMVIVEYPSIQTLVKKNKVKFIPSGFIGSTILKYKVISSTGVESNIGRVNINSINSNINTTDKSICIGELVDLNSLVEDSSMLQWSFIGFTTEISDIPGNLNSSTFSVGDIIGNPVLNITEPGVYTFQYGEVGVCSAYTTVNVEVIDDNQQVDLTLSVCSASDSNFNLNTLTNVDSGTWVDLNQTNVLESDGFTVPNSVSPGFYNFRYSKLSSGIYNSTTCNNTFILTLEVQEPIEEIDKVCLTYCSYGPDVEVDESCKLNPIILTNTPSTGCEYDLYSQVGLPSGSRIQLLSAPFTPIYLNFNGIDMLFTEGSFLPEGIALWSNGNAPLGTYIFRAFYGDACEGELDFEVNIYQAACQIANDVIEKCNSDDTFNIFTEVTGNTNCLLNNVSSLTLVSENIVGDGVANYNLVTGDFTPTVPGQWVFNFKTTVVGTDENCSACNVDATLTVIISPIPGPGVPYPGTVCNDGDCAVEVYPDMFIPNQSILGLFCYDGFSTTTTGVPGTGGWGGTEPTLNPGDESGPSYSFEGANVGFYFFSNKVDGPNGCSASSQTIVQVTSVGAAGTPDSPLEICELNDTCIILRDMLTGEDDGGSWSTGGTYTTAFNSCDPGLYLAGDSAIFNTESMPSGTYTFTYTVTTPNALYPIYDGCVSCTGSSATLTIIITEAVSAGNGSSQMVCA